MARRTDASRTNKRKKHNATPHQDTASSDRRRRVQRRASKACDRCRAKKTKCNGVIPCERCSKDGTVCIMQARTTNYKTVPPGYVEVLEQSQLSLACAVQKLYSMVRNSQEWGFGEPGLSINGQPIVHDIVARLGCMRPGCSTLNPPENISPAQEPRRLRPGNHQEHNRCGSPPESSTKPVHNNDADHHLGLADDGGGSGKNTRTATGQTSGMLLPRNNLCNNPNGFEWCQLQLFEPPRLVAEPVVWSDGSDLDEPLSSVAVSGLVNGSNLCRVATSTLL